MRLLVDLQRVSEVVQSFGGCLEPDAIAKQTTDGLVEKFDCAFARIWIVESDRMSLRLVASSGLYTHTNGSFARVAVGAFKVGKIAQNRIPFLSNNLADEPWVKDRDWAIEQHITGFAGYPLMTNNQVVGVLAVFSYHPLSPEFLEVLQGLCMTVTIALEHALHYQQERQSWQTPSYPGIIPLSEQLAGILHHTRLTLVGTERSLTASLTCILLRTAEVLREWECPACRLSYEGDRILLEAMVFPPAMPPNELRNWATSVFGDLLYAATSLGGTLQTSTGANQKVVQLVLQLPYPEGTLGTQLRIHLSSPMLQMAMTHLAHLAKLRLCSLNDPQIPLLTDDLAQASASDRVLWLAHSSQSPPPTAIGIIDLSVHAAQLREAVEAATRGECWRMTAQPERESQILSEREQEIMNLLAEGLRDRDIANCLHISERTVKFHINNVLTKLNAKTRCQAMYQSVMLNGSKRMF
ncbi:MAG: GAF domain-containing protein [Cyanobacteria bacterium CRU_2_1]|nr:GAF domain-containing protein [Cyanobacteria bacterium RU_5_0]NJR61967.1 GAF domain-containing protein [Cyanobacteria bacterium CRU_2_1]